MPAVGTRTFLFSDIEGSTNLLQDLGDGYPLVLAHHHRLLRETWATHRGVEVGTEGDSFFVVFERAADAVAAARDAQVALAAYEWPHDQNVRIRIGLHTGEVDLTPDGYVGLAVHIAARISAAGHGGQVLLSEATRHLVADVEAADQGEHRLKDIRRPVRLFQLLDDRLADTFPRLRTLTSMPNNLPTAVDDFVGRVTEISETLTALDHHRLTTLTGSGGSGKTRLALEVATQIAHRVSDGVWLVELATIDDDQRISAAVAAAVGVVERSGRRLGDTLAEWLASRDLLILLDNCEHVIGGVAKLTSELLTVAPSVRILATSRERLNLRGEHVIALAPLQVPDELSLAAESDAVQLFLARARAAVPAFSPSGSALGLVVDVCRRLDGLPLALELAAARLRTVSLEQLAVRLDDRFRILATSDRNAPDRQRTLAAVVAWSYDLLDASEKIVFDRLSVFPGSFSLDAAETVCAGDGIELGDVLDNLARLVDKSLVSTVETQDGEMRYRMLETLRQYGQSRLTADELEWAQKSLLRWALRHVDVLEAAMRTSAQDAALQAVVPERINLRAAMDWALETEDLRSALRIVSAVPVDIPSVRLQLIQRLTGVLVDLPPEVLGQALMTQSNLEMERGEWADSLDAARRCEDAFQEAEDGFRSSWARFFQIWGAWGLDQSDLVRSLSAQVLSEFREAGDEFGIAYASWTSSMTCPDPLQARALAAEACTGFRAIGAPFGLAHALEGSALIELRNGRNENSVPYIRESLELFRASGNAGCTAHCLEAVAACLADAGSLREAAEIVSAAEAFRGITGHGHRPWEQNGYDEAQRALGQADGAFDAAHTAGRSHSLSSASERAMTFLTHLRSPTTP